MTTTNNTLLAEIQRGADILKNAWAGVHFDAAPNAKFDAQVLLCAATGYSSAQLFAHGHEPISETASIMYGAYLMRRAIHEPVALIIGKKEFYGRSFQVTRATLIPRPETELMIETALPLIDEDTVVVDVGTGSGAIGVTCALEKKTAIVAIDASEDALEVAKTNAKLLGADEFVAFAAGNLLLPFLKVFPLWPNKEKVKHILIAANLPYLSKNQWEALDPNVKNFEPKSALVGGRDGLELYDELLMQLKAVRTTLPERITLLFEIDSSQKESAPKLISAHFPFANISVTKDLAGLDRLVAASV